MQQPYDIITPEGVVRHPDGWYESTGMSVFVREVRPLDNGCTIIGGWCCPSEENKKTHERVR